MSLVILSIPFTSSLRVAMRVTINSSSLNFKDNRIGAIDDNHIGAKFSKTPRLMYPSGIELEILI